MNPPQSVPQDLLDEYTMHGRIPILNWYFDDRPKSDQPIIYTQDTINHFLQMAIARKTNYYGITDTYLYQALDKYPIQGLSVAIMGSQQPWYESICLAYGGHPTVIDYHKIESQHPSIKTITMDEYEQNRITFDTAISISSFEHDGLGRYGDLLSPNADLLTMQNMKDVVKADGILYLSIPVGRDKLIWNAHRIYGRHRLPKLLQGWKILDAFGYSTSIYDEDTGLEAKYQPVFILQNSQEDFNTIEFLENFSKPASSHESLSGEPIKLHLGCGEKRLPGFIHVDVRPDTKPDIVAEATSLAMFANDSVDLIYFCHGLEHIPPQRVGYALAEWKRILKPGGVLRLALPDFEVLAKLYVLNQVPLEAIVGIIHGGQDYPENTHYWSWDFQSLYRVLTKAGFENIRRYDAASVNPVEYEDHSTAQVTNQLVSLNVEATKANQVPKPITQTASIGHIITLSIQTRAETYNLKMLINQQEYTQKLMIDAFSKGIFYEPEVVQLLIQLLQPGDSFIDVGGHIGYFSLFAALLVGEKGLVLTCEPEGYNYDRILQNVQLNGFRNLRVLNVAVGNERKDTRFFVNSDNDGGHALWDVGNHPFNQKSKQSPIAKNIRMETLDYLAAQHQLHNLKLIKIDTEGAEHSILGGAVDLLTRVKVPYIIAEINAFGLNQMGTSEIELRKFMESLGYETFVLTAQPPNLIPLKSGQFHQSKTIFNVLFTNQNLLTSS